MSLQSSDRKQRPSNAGGRFAGIGIEVDMPAIDALSFLMAWTMAPPRIGSVTPSSSSLAALMTREVDPETTRSELGSRTVPFTRAQLALASRSRI